MQTLVTCRSNRQHGFTLLEMLVVLFLIGLVTAVAMPGLQRMNASLERSLKRDQLQSLVNSLAQQVRTGGHPVTLTQAPGQTATNFPPGFTEKLNELNARLTASQPIFISAAGFCPFGGELRIEINGHQYNGRLQAPACRLQW